MLRKLYIVVVRLEQFIARSILIVIVLLTFGSAMSRTFGFPLAWSMDLVMLLFAWFGFLAASQATRRGAHLGVDIITNALPQKAQQCVLLFNRVLMAAFTSVIIYASFKQSISNYERMINTIDLSYSAITISLTVGCVLMLISLCIQIFDQIRVILGKMTEEEAEGAWQHAQ
jgi:TRAP-type C4-dicarboxylate transport system permease small subunit